MKKRLLFITVAIICFITSHYLVKGQTYLYEDFEEGDFRRYNSRFSAENFNKNLEIVKKGKEIATAKSVTPSQIALAWVISKGDDVFPIPGTKRIKYLKENIEAITVNWKITKLSSWIIYTIWSQRKGIKR